MCYRDELTFFFFYDVLIEGIEAISFLLLQAAFVLLPYAHLQTRGKFRGIITANVPRHLKSGCIMNMIY